jgi:hypothetical protein
VSTNLEEVHKIYTGEIEDSNGEFKIDEMREFVKGEFEAYRRYARYLSLMDYQPSCGMWSSVEETLYGKARHIIRANPTPEIGVIVFAGRDLGTTSFYTPPYPFLKFDAQ